MNFTEAEKTATEVSVVYTIVNFLVLAAAAMGLLPFFPTTTPGLLLVMSLIAPLGFVMATLPHKEIRPRVTLLGSLLFACCLVINLLGLVAASAAV